jgi:hypothetical protein
MSPPGYRRHWLRGDVAEEIRTIAAFCALCGEGLCIGYDAVGSACDACVDVERHLAPMARG